MNFNNTNTNNKVINDVDRINIVVNGQACTSAGGGDLSKSSKTLNETNNNTKNCVSAINNTINRLKMEHRQQQQQQQQQHQKNRPADQMNTEWDQVIDLNFYIII